MRTLILGGPAWLGRHVALEALRRGHDLTCLARGSAPVPDRVRLVRADRNEPGAYAAVAAEPWDLVVDVSRQPGQVRTATEALAGAGLFVFVSSANVYADHRTIGQNESAPLLAPLGPLLLVHAASPPVECEEPVLAQARVCNGPVGAMRPRRLRC